MMGNTPAWYITTQEFADNVVNLLDELNYFKREERVHPEDIVAAFGSMSEAFARGAGVAGRKVYESKKTIQK